MPTFPDEALRRLDERDPGDIVQDIVNSYEKDAKIRVFSERSRPPHPHEIRGADAIKGWARYLVKRRACAEIVDEVSNGDGRVARRERWTYPDDGEQVLGMYIYELGGGENGKIVDQVGTEVWYA